MLGLPTFKQQDSHLPPDLMGDVGQQMPVNDAMPGRVVLFVELFLNEGSDP